MSNPCPCNSGKEFSKCCGPFLAGDAFPETAEALMRSRYTAFTKEDIDYIRNTRHPQSEHKFDEVAIRKWAKESDWLGLEILSTEAGQKEDGMGTVEFMAKYTVDGEPQDHHEVAKFQKDEDKWYFVDGDFVRAETVRRTTAKIGRNAPCHCGSGKKFKKCCGR